MPVTTSQPRRSTRSHTLRRAAEQLAVATRELLPTHAADDLWLPPAVACGAFVERLLHCCRPVTSVAAKRLTLASPAWAKVFEHSESSMNSSLVDEAHRAAEAIGGASDSHEFAQRATEFTEQFLASYDAAARKRHGMYYTPRVVADYLVARADAALCELFPATSGLTHARAIFDPAVGTGVFPLAVIDRVYASLSRQWQQAGRPVSECPMPWDDYVRTHLLARLRGCELIAAAHVVAQMLIGERLAAYGFQPQTGDRLCIEHGDSLSFGRDPSGSAQVRNTSSALHALPDGSRLNDGDPLVVLGNPPYRGVSASDHAWVDALLRGRAPDGRAVASYFHVDGAPLGEKKHWLHDDYVKFFRLAQWHVEQAGAGVVAFVTNHGFLDNPTFRGMRCGLLATFDTIEVVDLHGNVKHGATERDESVFSTQQGMALSLLVASGGENRPRVVRRADLYGTRRDKLAQLSADAPSPLTLQTVQPQAPHYFFHATTDGGDDYARFWPIDEWMPVNTTAIVTARDAVVIAFTRAELVERLERFRDLSISDEQIRRELFPRSRTRKYLPGDTRGWELRAAREQLAANDRWRENIRTCLYRSFDRRYIYWSPAMVDWPRRDVMRHLEAGDNLAIVCRRQQVRGAPCNFFWIADDLVVDGYIRSDNRGSESVFPLWLTIEGEVSPPDKNFSPAFFTAVAQLLGDVSPQQLFSYIYGIFHSPAYRKLYAEPMSCSFPRVPLARSRELFDRLASLGSRLIDLHLLRDPTGQASDVCFVGEEAGVVSAGYPQFQNGAVAINKCERFAPISETVWNFRVGAHQVLRKWLKDRRGRTLSAEEIIVFPAIVRSIELSIASAAHIDAAVNEHGGWPRTFALDDVAPVNCDSPSA